MNRHSPRRFVCRHVDDLVAAPSPLFQVHVHGNSRMCSTHRFGADCYGIRVRQLHFMVPTPLEEFLRLAGIASHCWRWTAVQLQRLQCLAFHSQQFVVQEVIQMLNPTTERCPRKDHRRFHAGKLRRDRQRMGSIALSYRGQYVGPPPC